MRRSACGSPAATPTRASWASAPTPWRRCPGRPDGASHARSAVPTSPPPGGTGRAVLPHGSGPKHTWPILLRPWQRATRRRRAPRPLRTRARSTPTVAACPTAVAVRGKPYAYPATSSRTCRPTSGACSSTPATASTSWPATPRPSPSRSLGGRSVAALDAVVGPKALSDVDRADGGIRTRHCGGSSTVPLPLGYARSLPENTARAEGARAAQTRRGAPSRRRRKALVSGPPP